MKVNVKAAIVTTLVNAGHVLDTFIKYHLHAGFDRIYLFFDDVDDRTIDQVKSLPQVTAIPCSDHLRDRWKATRVYEKYPQYHNFIGQEPIARQMLNMEIACEMAIQDKIDWILHIDIDELFYSPSETVKEHFTRLSRNRISCMKYLNYEAVPEKIEVKNFFTEVTLFKKNPGHNTILQQRVFKKKYDKNLFNYYINGKSAADVKKIVLPGIHDFTIETETKSIAAQLRDHIISKATLLRNAMVKQAFRDPIILHYPVCGFDHFWDKYIRLGNFNDRFFGVGHIPHPLHLSARDVVNRGDKRAALELYEKKVMLKENDITELMNIGLLLRIPEVAQTIRRI
jgi:hypothetical protein